MPDQVCQLGGPQTVHHQNICARRDRFRRFSLVGDLSRDHMNVTDCFARTLYRGPQTAGNTCVVRLDAKAVVQTVAMICAAAKQDRVLLKHPQAGRSFPGIRDLRFTAFNCADKLAGDGSHARQVLQEVERHSLAREQDVGKAARARDYFAGFNLFAIRSKRFELLLWIQRDKDFFSGFQSGDYHCFAGDKTTTRPRIPRQNTLRGDIATTEIFPQKESYARVERTFVNPIHKSSSWERGQAGSPAGQPRLGCSSCPHSAQSALKMRLFMKAPPAFDLARLFAE